MPPENVFHIPDSIPFDEAAVLSDGAATAYHAIDLAGKGRFRLDKSISARVSLD